MSSFLTYLPLLQKIEAGFQINPNDSGNWTGGKIGVGNLVGTNWGISAPTYGAWIKRVPTEANMRNMPKSVAVTIFETWYWKPMKASLYNNQSVANIIVDHAINGGVGTAAFLLQRVLKNVFNKNIGIDGLIGNETVTALNSVNQEQLFNAIKKARYDAYISQNNSTFGNGWLNRLDDFFFQTKH